MKALLQDYNQTDVEKYCSYVEQLRTEKKKDGNNWVLKNDWAVKRSDEKFAEYFRIVANDGLVLDGKDITVQKTGISYSYVAYKNKMLLAYPESMVDVSLVYDGDEFSFQKESGKVIYSHTVANPFKQKSNQILGGYCVIKNKRGEFLTTLSTEEIEKHRLVAKTDTIWQHWTREMYLKTLIKKACSQHFRDVFTTIEEQDNTQNDLEQPLNIELQWKQEIEAIETIEKLKEYWEANKGKGKEFAKLVTSRKAFLTLTQE